MRGTGPPLARFAADATPEEVCPALERDGGVVVESLAEGALAAALRADLAPHLEAVEWGHNAGAPSDDFAGRRTKRLHGLLARSEAFGRWITHPLLRAVAEHFLGPHSRDLRLSTGELMALGEGQEAQMLHRDADSWHHVPRPRPTLLVSATLALTDFSAENGATRLAPGSHRWSPERRAREEELARATMPAGSVLLYDGDLLHGAGANRTDEVRLGLYVGFIPSWLRPIENHAVTNGLASLERAPREVARLLDYHPTGFTVVA